jgi:polyhydroxyalkanoate synthesis regulator phasin
VWKSDVAKCGAEAWKDQAERSKRKAQKLIDGGELNATKAEIVVDRLMRQPHGA